MQKKITLGLNTKSVRGVHPAYSAYSLYKARVESDGGYIQNELKTREYFSTPGGGTRGYVGYAGIKTSLFEGRVVVDKVYDLHGVADQVFAGLDRPELLTWQTEQASWGVEKDTTNLIPEANQKFEGGSERSGATVTLTQNQTLEGITDQATRIQSTGGTSIQKYLIDFGNNGASNDDPISVWFPIHNIGDNPLNIWLTTGIVDGDTSATFTVLAGEFTFVKIRAKYSDVSLTHRFEFRTANASHDIDCIAFQPMLENSAYNTQFTTGTRTAPATVLDNFLPDTGWIGGVVDVIRDGSTQLIIQNNSTASYNITQVVILNNEKFRYDYGGRVGGGGKEFDIPFVWDLNTRKVFAYIMFGESSDQYLCIIMPDGKIYKNTSTGTPDTTYKNLTIGANKDGSTQTSLYQSAIESGDDAYSDEFMLKQIEKMTAGDIRFKDAVWEIQP